MFTFEGVIGVIQNIQFFLLILIAPFKICSFIRHPPAPTATQICSALRSLLQVHIHRYITGNGAAVVGGSMQCDGSSGSVLLPAPLWLGHRCPLAANIS